MGKIDNYYINRNIDNNNNRVKEVIKSVFSNNKNKYRFFDEQILYNDVINNEVFILTDINELNNIEIYIRL
eukprot:jgi/Orpsp1_1/1181672/evm.model.c7180000078130.1